MDLEKRLGDIIRRNDSSGTRITPLQPLNVIGGVDESSTNEEQEIHEENIDKKEGEWKHFREICQECYIPNVTDSCRHCGIYQFGVAGNTFEIQVRRRL